VANQYSGLDGHEYEGWKNRSTWNISLWKSNEEPWQRRYERIVDRVAEKVGPTLSAEAGWNAVARLYREVWEEAARGDGCIWKNVDWEELKEHFIEDVKDAKR
jgi:hypothetical protein